MARDAPDDSWDLTFDLLVLARAGDKAALNLLFERHQPILQRWARARLPRSAPDIDTTDLVHESIVRTVARIDDFGLRTDEAVQAYLRAVVMNRIRDEVRRKRRSDGSPT